MSRGIVMSMRSQVLSFLLFSTMYGLLAATVPSVWIGMSTQNGDSLGFMLIPSFLHLNAKLSSACVQLPCCDSRCTARDQIVNGIVEKATQFAFWVHVRLLEVVELC